MTVNKFTKIWNTFEDYDETVNNMLHQRNQRNTVYWIWSIIISNGLIWLLINQLGMLAFAETFFTNFTYLILYLGSSISVTKFSGTIMMLSQRLKHLNEIALESLPSNKSSRIIYYPKKNVNVELIVRLYENLVAAGESLDDIYSWSLIAWLGNLTLHIVSDFYFVISWLLNSNDYFYFIICLLSWLSISMWQIFLINWACHSATFEVSLSILMYSFATSDD